MKKSIKPKKPDLADLIDKMTQQLIILEKKIDALSASRRPDIIPLPPGRKPDNNFRERVLHKAVCAACNKECEVPFRPSGDRPVYCKECFAKRKNGAMQPAAKPVNKPAERVVVYERRFQRDQAPESPKKAEKKRPTARRKK